MNMKVSRKVIAIIAVPAAAAAAAVMFAVAPGSAAVSHEHRAASIAGLWDEHATQLSGPEKGLKEHFQVFFDPDGFFFQLSGTAGDATAIGTWQQEGNHVTVVFDALAQGDPTFDYFKILLTGTLSSDGEHFTFHGYATGIDHQGHVALHGEALNTGVRLAAADPGR